MKRLFLLTLLLGSSVLGFTNKHEFVELYNKKVSRIDRIDQPKLARIKDKVMNGSVTPRDLKTFWFGAKKQTVDELRRVAIEILRPSAKGKPPSDITMGLTMIQKIIAIAKQPHQNWPEPIVRTLNPYSDKG